MGEARKIRNSEFGIRNYGWKLRFLRLIELLSANLGLCFIGRGISEFFAFFRRGDPAWSPVSVARFRFPASNAVESGEMA